MPGSICRWGILGTANIARKNWNAIRLAENSSLVAVASREIGRAQQFISDCQAAAPVPTVPQACRYEELLQRSDIDAVYIPLPTGIRVEWVTRAAQARKHILCEKPCAPSANELKPMLEACQKHQVQFMDGVMFMHSQRLPMLRRTLDDSSSVGTLRRITSQFSFAAPDEFLTSNIRSSHELEPLGCLGDLGWYNVRFSLWAMNYQMPTQVAGRLLHQHGTGSNAVPLEFTGELLFPDGVTAAFYCSFRTENQQWAHISGTKGSVHIADFVLPFYGAESTFEVNRPSFQVEGCGFHMESHPRRYAVREYSDGMPNSQETNMIRRFAELVIDGTVDPYWSEIALKTQRVVDACLQSARDGGRQITL